MRKFCVILAVCLCLVGCSINKEDEVKQYKYWYDCELVMQNGTTVNAFITDFNEKGYFSIGEQKPTDIGLPYNPQIDVYFNNVLDTLSTEVTSNMEDIVLATTSGVYDGNVWYFLLQSYYDTSTANQIINIMGVLPVENSNLIVTSFGIEDTINNINTDVLSEMFSGYGLTWSVEDIINLER